VQTAVQPTEQGLQQLGSQLPSLLGNPQVSQLLQQALGGGDLQQTINKTKNELKKLQKDLKSTPEAGALDSYIQMFDLLGSLAPLSNPHGPSVAPNSSSPKRQPQAPRR
jgi:hypothetical protein